MQDMSGFSLLELLIVIAIVSILTAIAIPSYQHHMQKAHRRQAKLALHHASNSLEHYFVTHHGYTGATLDNLSLITSVAEKHYRLAITQLTATYYKIRVTPQGSQQKDVCGWLQLDSLGVYRAQHKQAGC